MRDDTDTQPGLRRCAFVLSAILIGYGLAYLFPMATPAHAQTISASATLRPNSVIPLSSGPTGWKNFSTGSVAAGDIADDNPRTGVSGGAAMSSHYSLQIGFAPFNFPSGARISSVTLRANESCAYNPQFYAFLLAVNGTPSPVSSSPPAYQFMPPGRMDTYSPSWTTVPGSTSPITPADLASPKVQVNLDTGPTEAGQASISEMYLDVAYTYTVSDVPTCCVPGGPLVTPIPTPPTLAPTPVPAVPKSAPASTPIVAQPVVKAVVAPVVQRVPPKTVVPSAVPPPAPVAAPPVPSATPLPSASPSPIPDASPLVDALSPPRPAAVPHAAPKVKPVKSRSGVNVGAWLSLALIIGLALAAPSALTKIRKRPTR